MADKSISDLRELGLSGVRENDPLAIVNVGASETMKVQVKHLIQAGILFIEDGSIPIEKVDFTLPAGSVGTDELADHSVTAIKLADDSVCIVADGPPTADGEYEGQLYLDFATSKIYCWSGSSWQEVVAPGSVNAINGEVASALPAVTTVTAQVGDTVTIGAVLPDTTGAAQFAAGPTNGPGSITARPIVGADLPTATGTEKGAVVVNGDGLRMDGDRIEIDNDVPEQTQRGLVTYDQKGLVTGGSPLEATDLPPATDGGIGGVKPGPGLEVDVDGTLGHPTGVTPGSYPKVTVTATGHVSSGLSLEASDIPNLSYDKITSGQVQPGSLAENCVTGPTIADYATAFMQEGSPGQGDFLGQLWFEPSTSQLRIYARGSNGLQWVNVGFGALQANNLRWGGSYDADTNSLTVLTSIGTGEGLTAGDPFPVATDALSGMYFICQNGGSNMTQPDLDGINHTPGDWALCIDEKQGWMFIDAAAGGGGGGGGASYLNDLLDVELTGTAADDLLKYDGGTGLWKNNAVIDGGSID